MKIHEWVHNATTELVGVGIGTAKLDAELILSHTVGKPRTWLHMYRDEEIMARHQEIADARLSLRLDRVPLAYIIGHKEFYGRRFDVTPSVLIPRPESEAIIDALKELIPNTRSLTGYSKRLIDVGTGSGCLGITAKLEFPELDVTLADIQKHALKVAQKNADRLGAEVKTIVSNLLSDYHLSPDIIIANLPYVDEGWERSPETEHEPAEALFAQDGGLLLIKRLLQEAGEMLPAGGLIILEADPVQHTEMKEVAKRYGLKHLLTRDYAICFSKA